jgi:hypothetical protein
MIDLKPPRTAAEIMARRIDACEHTGVSKPECSCYDCMEQMIRGYAPDVYEEPDAVVVEGELV